MTLGEGSSAQITAIISSYDGDVSWSSSDTSKAEVRVDFYYTTNTSSAHARVYGTGVGTAIVTATTSDGKKTATCTVTVTDSGRLPPPNGTNELSGKSIFCYTEVYELNGKLVFSDDGSYTHYGQDVGATSSNGKIVWKIEPGDGSYSWDEPSKSVTLKRRYPDSMPSSGSLYHIIYSTFTYSIVDNGKAVLIQPKLPDNMGTNPFNNNDTWYMMKQETEWDNWTQSYVTKEVKDVDHTLKFNTISTYTERIVYYNGSVVEYKGDYAYNGSSVYLLARSVSNSGSAKTQEMYYQSVKQGITTLFYGPSKFDTLEDYAAMAANDRYGFYPYRTKYEYNTSTKILN